MTCVFTLIPYCFLLVVQMFSEILRATWQNHQFTVCLRSWYVYPEGFTKSHKSHSLHFQIFDFTQIQPQNNEKTCHKKSKVLKE